MRYYLDHNACSTLHAAARASIAHSLEDWPHNPGSIHRDGQRARAIKERARRALVAALGDHGQLIFTGSATEANNLVIANLPGPIAFSPLEHASVRASILRGAGGAGTPIVLRHDSAGRIAPDEVSRAIDAGARSVSLMLANNELGNRNPIDEVAALCARRGIRLHVDAVQVFGRERWVPPGGVSAVSVSAHKAGGPVGTGALWLPGDLTIEPQIVGGHQERDRRAGTEDVAYAAAWAAVVEATDDRWLRLGPVRDALEARLVERLGAVVNGDLTRRIPNTTNVSFVGRSTEEVLMALDLAGIAASGGSACSTGSLEVSAVIAALGVSDERTRSAVRFSLGPEHADLDVDAIVERMAKALER